MARKVTSRRVWVSTGAAWFFGFLIFLPILWMFLTSFKTELEAFAMPPVFLFFHWTTENYATVQGRSDYIHHALNSILIAGGSTLIAMLIAVPAAWSMAFAPTKRTKDVLLWMLSTKMMPPVGVLVPIYLIYRDFGMLDTRAGLVMILCLGNLPIVIWMLFTYFKEIPKDILEAARMDGATIGRELVYVLAPMAIPGLASTLLLNFILAWNEAFWTLNLSTLDAAPLTVFIASYSSPEGLFWAKLSAASTLAIAPIIVLGWFTQRQLVRGLTFGAVKWISERARHHGPDHASGSPQVVRAGQHHQGCKSGHRGRRLRGFRRTVRLRQDHAVAFDCRTRGRHRRKDPDRRPQCGGRAAGEARSVDGVSVLCALSAYERSWQHCVRPEDGWAAASGDRPQGGGRRRHAESHALSRSQAARSLRRAASTRRDRAGYRARAEGVSIR